MVAHIDLKALGRSRSRTPACARGLDSRARPGWAAGTGAFAVALSVVAA